MEIAYVMAKEEVAFKKFGALVNLEKRHGVHLGDAYNHRIAAAEFTATVGEEIESDLKTALEQANFFSICCDGSTDVSIIEKELIYVKFINTRGATENHIMGLRDISSADANGLQATITATFSELGITNFSRKLVGFCADGASVNFGVKGGLVPKLKEDSPWLVSIHCLSHRLELSLKDAFRDTYFDTISEILLWLHGVYGKSPKRFHGLKALAEVMDEQVHKPARAEGTRWIQHKVKAASVLVSGYPVFVTHLEKLAQDEPGKQAAKIRGYVKIMKSFKYLSCLLAFVDLLVPIARLSVFLQGDATNLMMAKTSIDTTKKSLHSAANVHSEELTNLIQQTESSEEKPVEFRSSSLSDRTRPGSSFMTSSYDVIRKVNLY